MWALGVVVLDVDAQDAIELAPAKDEQLVKAFGAHEALGVRVRLGRLKRCLDHLGAFAAEDLVEAGDELRVAIADQDLTSPSAPARLRLRACCVTQRPLGFAVEPARWRGRV